MNICMLICNEQYKSGVKMQHLISYYKLKNVTKFQLIMEVGTENAQK